MDRVREDDDFLGRAREQVGRVLELLAATGPDAGLAWVVHPRGGVLVRGARPLMLARDLIASVALEPPERPQTHDVLGMPLVLHARSLRSGWVLAVLVDRRLDGGSVARRLDRAADLLRRAIVWPRGGSGAPGGGGAEALVGLV